MTSWQLGTWDGVSLCPAPWDGVWTCPVATLDEYYARHGYGSVTRRRENKSCQGARAAAPPQAARVHKVPACRACRSCCHARPGGRPCKSSKAICREVSCRSSTAVPLSPSISEAPSQESNLV